MTTTESRARLIALEHDYARALERIRELERALRSITGGSDDLEAIARAHAARNYAPEVYDDVE
jgi:chromosome segregation ATPase